jgi:hypothetical protein
LDDGTGLVEVFLDIVATSLTVWKHLDDDPNVRIHVYLLQIPSNPLRRKHQVEELEIEQSPA